MVLLVFSDRKRTAEPHSSLSRMYKSPDQQTSSLHAFLAEEDVLDGLFIWTFRPPKPFSPSNISDK